MVNNGTPTKPSVPRSKKEYPIMLFPIHPPDSKILLRFAETDAKTVDRLSVISSSLFFIGAVSWLPVLSVWAYRRSKQTSSSKRKKVYAALGVVAATLLLTPWAHSRRVGDALRLRQWKLWTSWLKYLAVEVIQDQNVNKSNRNSLLHRDDPAILAIFSHGVFPFSLALAALPQLMTDTAIGAIRPIVATATKYLPLVNVVLAWLGAVDASRPSVDRSLARGDRIGLIPGGIAEIFEGYPKPGTDPQTEYAIVRRGFLHLAVRHRRPIVPVYCFGSTKLFRRLELRVLERISAWIKASVVVFYGVCGLPIPFRQKLSYVMGNPIYPPTSTATEGQAVDVMYQSLCNELVNIFERHKEAYGWPHKSLELIQR